MRNINVQPVDTDNSMVMAIGKGEQGLGRGDICNSVNNKIKGKKIQEEPGNLLGTSAAMKVR